MNKNITTKDLVIIIIVAALLMLVHQMEWEYQKRDHTNSNPSSTEIWA